MKVALYARISTSDGKQDFTRQLQELRAICKQHGYKDSQIEEYAEAISGYKKDERLQLQAMLNKIGSKPSSYKCVYTSEISRIGRNPTETRRIIDRLTDLNVPVYIQSLNLYTIENGKRSLITSIILQVLMEYAHLEAETIKARSKSGMLKAAKDGRALGGINLPYGYTKDQDGFLVIDEEEAEVIEQIFHLYKKGNGIKVISNILNEQGVLTRSNKVHNGKTIKFKIPKDGSSVKWSDKQIHDILRNPLYMGKRRYKGELLNAPAIIDEELYNECTEIMQGKTHRNYLTTYTYLLKDLCVCGVCGRNYYGRYKPAVIVNGKNRFENYYQCSSALEKSGRCKNCGVNISLIESALFHILVNTDSVMKYLSDSNNLKIDIEQRILMLQQTISINTKQLEQKNKEKERLLDIYLSGALAKNTYMDRQSGIDKDLNSITNTIELAKKELREKKKALADINNPKMTRKNLLNAKANRSQIQAIFKQIFSKIIFNKLDNDHVLATVYITLNGVVLKNTLKVLLDISGMRKNPKVYRYKTFEAMQNEPVFDDRNILMVDAGDILGELSSDQEFLKDIYKDVQGTWNVIPNDQILTIE